jgi:exopolyphosphatase/guanosine-5'-triphosphate,3'-diphosphate pyrophosphatase
MGVDHLKLVATATAAVREASDGQDFVAQVKNRFGLDIQVLSGPEEAKLAATILLNRVPKADGLVGDLGGGSLDLVALNRGEFGEQGSLLVGHLVLAEALEGGREAVR